MIEVTLTIPENCTECYYRNYCSQSAYGLGLCKYKTAIEAEGQRLAREYDTRKANESNN